MEPQSRGWAIGLACRAMIVAAIVAATGNSVQALQGTPELYPAAAGALIAAAVHFALIRPVEEGRAWALPAVLVASIGWLGTALLLETEGGAYLYACFGPLYVTMLGSLASARPQRWAFIGAGLFAAGLLGRQLIFPLPSLADPVELAFAVAAGAVATWAVSIWMLHVLERVERVKSELELARDEAVEANLVKDRFLANMSHELRTPLTAIHGYADLLLDEARLDTAARSDVEAIQSSARHLTELLSAVLDFSRIDAGDRAVDLVEADLGDLLADTIRAARPLAVPGDNRLETVLAPDLGTGQLDPVMVRQILLNLVANACKFTEGGTVTVSAERRDGSLELRVSDTGIGIPEDRLDTVFDRFVQADSSATRRHDGVGLGLALVYRLCELLGGSIAVESEVGVGTVFFVRLPLSPR
ncbi:MAG: HAMP domain-containing sensor histidine kinase [Myxococcota bacterium]